MLIQGKKYLVVDTKEKLTIADSFVVRSNKIGSGNGEAKLYIGQNNEDTEKFFGHRGFVDKCFLLKKDLIKYLIETKDEYFNPEQPYIGKSQLSSLWFSRFEYVKSLPDIIFFYIKDQNQISGPRVYINSYDSQSKAIYNLIRELSLPNITYISIVKLYDLSDGNKEEFIYYFRLFADYFGEVTHPSVVKEEEKKIESEHSEDLRTSEKLIQARKGQGEYRRRLLEQCPYCPITMVSDDRLLIASHIKPWARSNNFEKTDPYNGFMFTPTIDYLFDRGFITFNENQEILLSPFLSKITYSKLGLTDNKRYPLLKTDGREDYLAYHRTEIWKG